MLAASSRRGHRLAAALSRGRATVAAATTAGPQESTEEWRRARPFEEIPGPKALPIIGNVWRFMLPTGDFKGLDILDLFYHMRDKYGDICKLDGLPGRPPMVFLFNANDIEKVYRHEGPRPVRDSIQSLKFYREVTRRDLYGDVQGVAFTQGEQWFEFRRRVNQPMMQPRSSKLYVPSIDQVAQDFTDRMLAIRDENMKMPPDFLNELNKWALESISLVALDTRLGCLDGNLPADSEPQRMIEAAHTVFDCMLKLDVKPSLWRFVSTPNWRRLVRAQDYFYQLRPVALAGSRQVVVDNLVLSNYRIPKGMDLTMGNVVLTNSEEHFSRPSDFLPERWLKGGEAAQAAHPFAFMPFGFGPRTCIGRRFAELEIYTLLARVVRRFRLEFDGEMRWRTTVLHGPVAPLTIKVTERGRQE